MNYTEQLFIKTYFLKSSCKLDIPYIYAVTLIKCIKDLTW